MATDPYAPIFEDAGKEWNVDPRLLRAVMARESGGDASAVSPKGATGLMQIMPPTGADLGVTDPKNPAQSIFAGAKYLSQQLDKYKDVGLGLAAYNAGPGRTDEYVNKQRVLPDETLAYVPHVMARYVQAKAAPSPQDTGVAPVAQAAKTSGVPSDADFLKMIGAAPAANGNTPAPAPAPTKGGIPSDTDFLKMIGATPAAPPPAPEAPSPQPQIAADAASLGIPPSAVVPNAGPTPTPPVAVNPNPARAGTPDMPGTPTMAFTPPQQPGFFSHVGSAVASPFEGGQLGPDTSGSGYNGSMGLVNRLLVAQPLALADAVGRAGLGAWRGLVAAGSEGLQGLGASPTNAASFERDLGGIAPNALAPLTMGADAALASGVKVASAPDVAANRLAGNTAIGDRLQTAIESDVRGPGRGKFLLDKLTTAIKEADAPPPVEAGAGGAVGDVVPGMGGRQPVGAAAASDTEAAMSPREAQAQRSTGEIQKLVEPQPKGADTNHYVPGVSPTEAQMVQDARTSRNEKLTAAEMPQGFADRARDNNDARLNFFDDAAGTPTLQKRLVDDRSAAAEADLAKTWQNKQPANTAPVADVASEILNSPDGRRPLVRAAVSNVMKELVGPDGQPITDPEMLYGVRKHIDDLMQGAKDSAAGTRVVGQLQQIKDTLDGVIEQGAPGFKQYLKNFAEASKPIDEMDVLQKYRTKIVDSQNRMTYSGVQRMMKDIVAARGSKGIDPAKSISDDTMNKLWSLRDDLRRVASSDDLAKAKGSDTFQNTLDFVKNAAGKGGLGAAHIAANAIAPGVGSLGLNVITNRLRQAQVAKAAERALNPPQNRLQGPMQ